MCVNGVWMVFGWKCLFCGSGCDDMTCSVNNSLRKQVAPIVGTCMVMVMMRILDRPVELVHPHLGVELNDGLGEGAGPWPDRLEVSRGGGGNGAGALFHLLACRARR